MKILIVILAVCILTCQTVHQAVKFKPILDMVSFTVACTGL